MFYKKFGHLRVFGISDRTDSTNVHFCVCVCDCGKLFHTRKVSIIKGRTKSCCGYVSISEEQERLKSHVTQTNEGCWIFSGNNYKRPNGSVSYGRFESKLFPEEYLAHRMSFLFFKGPIPNNAHICHLCDIESCVNPDHLFLGDAKINVLDREVKGRGQYGERNHNAKYTDKIVTECKRLYDNGASPKDISMLMEIPKSTINKFVYRDSWKHLN